MRATSSLLGLLRPYMALEPAFFLFNVAYELSELLRANLYLQKTCRRRVPRTEPDVRVPCDDEVAGIDFVAVANSRYMFAAAVTGTAFVVCLSTWSDKANSGGGGGGSSGGRRKISILVPMAFKLVQLVSMCAQSYWWHLPVWMAVVTESAMNAIIAVRVASVVYLCNVSSNETRTFRVTLLFALVTFSEILSGGCSGYLLRNHGFLVAYLLCATLALVSIVQLALFLPEPSSPTTTTTTTTTNVDPPPRIGCAKSVLQLLDVRNVLDAFRIVFKRRDGYDRLVITLLSVMSILAWFPKIGDQTMLYLYLRYKFGWNEQDYGLYVLYKLMGTIIGSIICLGLIRCLRITDSAMGTFASFWSILGAIGYYFATENWHLYLLPLLDIFRCFVTTLCDSLQTKYFEDDEFGRLYSVHETLNLFVALAYPAYNLLFQYTLDFGPNVVFLFSAVINTLLCLCYGICYTLMKTSTIK